MPRVLDLVGAMRERLAVQVKTPTADTQGGRAQVWSTHATIWGAVRPKEQSSSEQIQAGAVGSHVGYEIETWYRADLTPAMRISWTPYRGAAKTLQIHGIRRRDGEPVLTVLDCSEVV